MLAGGVGAGAAVAAGVVGDGFRSLHAPSESATSAAAIGKVNFFIWSPRCLIEIANLPRRLDAVALGPSQTHIFQARLAVNKFREPLQSTLSSCFIAVTQRLDLIVVASSPFVLAANHLLNFRR